jgi:hypothetical protein
MWMPWVPSFVQRDVEQGDRHGGRGRRKREGKEEEREIMKGRGEG